VSRIAPLVVLVTLLAAPALAQISTDGSLGPQLALPLEAGEYRIADDLGRYAGENLFHSFATFDVGTGETATFSADGGTPARVIARVTGGNGTQIDGTLRSSIAGADLFLLDSRGVSFGGGSRVEVDGSFYTSSADVLRFQAGPDFATADAAPEPLLSTAAPAAFGFTSLSPAQMVLARSDGLSVPEGETLSVVGGDVFVLGDLGSLSSAIVINAPGAQVEIASAAGPVDIPVELSGFDVTSAGPGTLGTIEFVAATALLNGTTAIPAGSLTIRGGEFVLSGGSRILAQNKSAADAVGPVDIAVSGDLRLLGNPGGSPQTLIQSWSQGEGAAGDVKLQGDTVEISGGARLQLFNGGSPAHTGEAPDLDIAGRVVEITGGSEVELVALSAGPASRLDVAASERIAIADAATVVAEFLSGNSGEPGVISLDAPETSILGGAQVSTVNAGDGAGTAIEVRGGRLQVADGGGILSEGGGPASRGGVLDLRVGELTVTDAGRIASISSGGTGGDIAVEADRVLVTNASGRPEGTFLSADDGGAIAIDAGAVELVDGGQIVTRAFGDTPAGPLAITADSVVASGEDAQGRPAGLFSRSRETASPTGTGGVLSVDTRVLEVANGAEISSASFGAADAGRVDIDASERVTVQGGAKGVSLISAAAIPGSSGNGGAIEIDADLIELRDGGQVTTSTGGVGDAGVIDARADRIEISGVDPLTGLNPSGFFSRSNTAAVPGGGDGGDILLVGGRWVRVSDEGIVSAVSTGTGLAGNIEIDGGREVRIDNAAVSTEALASSGGNVKVTADEVVVLENASIATDVLGGAGGGGDVTVDPVHTVLNRSGITARAVEGAGGNIRIVTDYFFQSGDSFLDASSELGIDGTVEVTSPDTDVTGGLVTLPAAYLDASALLARDCAARTERAGSFAVRPRPTVAPPPDAPLAPGDLGSCEGGSP